MFFIFADNPEEDLEKYQKFLRNNWNKTLDKVWKKRYTSAAPSNLKKRKTQKETIRWAFNLARYRNGKKY